MAEIDPRLVCWGAGVKVRDVLQEAYDLVERIRSAARNDRGSVVEYLSEKYRETVGQIDPLIRDAESCGETPISLSWIGRFREHKEEVLEPATKGDYPDVDLEHQQLIFGDVLYWLSKDTGVLPHP